MRHSGARLAVPTEHTFECYRIAGTMQATPGGVDDADQRRTSLSLAVEFPDATSHRPSSGNVGVAALAKLGCRSAGRPEAGTRRVPSPACHLRRGSAHRRCSGHQRVFTYRGRRAARVRCDEKRVVAWNAMLALLLGSARGDATRSGSYVRLTDRFAVGRWRSHRPCVTRAASSSGVRVAGESGRPLKDSYC